MIPLTVADLLDKGAGWKVYPALFARAGATPAAGQSLAEAGGLLIDRPTLFSDLAETSERGVETREPRRVRAWALVQLHDHYSDGER